MHFIGSPFFARLLVQIVANLNQFVFVWNNMPNFPTSFTWSGMSSGQCKYQCGVGKVNIVLSRVTRSGSHLCRFVQGRVKRDRTE